MEDKLYTINEAADYLRVHRTTIFKYIKEGKLKKLKIGDRNTRIPISSMEEFVEAGVE